LCLNPPNKTARHSAGEYLDADSAFSVGQSSSAFGFTDYGNDGQNSAEYNLYTMPRHSFDAMVVGAGIVGAACAYELMQAGLHVALCERNDYAGGGATAAGMGHLAVMDDSEAQFALTSYSQQLWNELARELPSDVEYTRCGSLWVAADEEEFAEVRRKFEYYSARGIPVEVLDGKQLAQAEPHLRPGMAGALLMSADSVCYPPCAARYFTARVRSAGGELYFQTEIAAVKDGGLVTSDGRFLSTGVAILATGTSITKLIPDIEVHPRKGHLVITERYPGFLRHQLIELGYLKSANSTTADSVAFNAQPRVTGQILIGSSRQFGVEDPATERHMLRNMLSRAIEYMPGLENLSAIRTWTGFRAATPDKVPLIGLCPGFRSVYLAVGHEGLGISTSLGTARLLADLILRRVPAIPAAPYEPSRSFAAHA
jgi:D-hydroxyproline dehydrogenase subunit beta